MRMARALAVALSAVLTAALPWAAASQPAGFRCGIDRWPIKTRYASGAPVREYGVAEFLALRPPQRSEKKGAYQDRLIEGGLEGAVVSLRGWLHGAALSANDGDYHVQITAAPDDCEEMVIVEIPHERCIQDQALADLAVLARQLIDRLLGGPLTTGYRRARPPVEVLVTGQLFYDLQHESSTSPGGGRGKGHCQAGGLWEIHPVTRVEQVRLGGDLGGRGSSSGPR